MILTNLNNCDNLVKTRRVFIMNKKNKRPKIWPWLLLSVIWVIALVRPELPGGLRIALLWLLALSIVTFMIFWTDHNAAVRNGRRGRPVRRIPEKVLMAYMFIGGAMGGLAGMLVFRHKTQKWGVYPPVIMIGGHLFILLYLFA